MWVYIRVPTQCKISPADIINTSSPVRLDSIGFPIPLGSSRRRSLHAFPLLSLRFFRPFSRVISLDFSRLHPTGKPAICREPRNLGSEARFINLEDCTARFTAIRVPTALLTDALAVVGQPTQTDVDKICFPPLIRMKSYVGSFGIDRSVRIYGR